MLISKRLCQKLGICWHEAIARDYRNKKCSCGKSFSSNYERRKHFKRANPDFVAHPWELIREMEKRGKLRKLLAFIYLEEFANFDPLHFDDFISRLIALDTTGKLAELADEFLSEQGVDK